MGIQLNTINHTIPTALGQARTEERYYRQLATSGLN